MVGYYKTISEDDQYLIYNVDKDYGWFFNKWGVFGYMQEQAHLCELKVSYDNFYNHFDYYIKKSELKDAQRDLIRNIL